MFSAWRGHPRDLVPNGFGTWGGTNVHVQARTSVVGSGGGSNQAVSGIGVIVVASRDHNCAFAVAT